MNNELFLEFITISTFASILSSLLIQKVKRLFNLGTIFNNIISLVISFLVGFSFSYSFYYNNILYSVWIGLFTLIGAENIYKAFKGRFGLESSLGIKGEGELKEK